MNEANLWRTVEALEDIRENGDLKRIEMLSKMLGHSYLNKDLAAAIHQSEIKDLKALFRDIRHANNHENDPEITLGQERSFFILDEFFFNLSIASTVIKATRKKSTFI